MYGRQGKILHIDLSSGKVRTEQPDLHRYMDSIGGRGLAGVYLHPSVCRAWDDPEMPLLLFAGPLVGTASPTSGRMTVMSRSPLTGTIGDASVGGSLGFELKRAGWDGIVITGKSDRLVGIEINDAEIALTDAAALEGLDTGRTAAVLEGKGSCAVIGPAAERGVLFACLIVDRHFAAGRNGIGLCFAAKNIKYMTVRGSGKVRVRDPEGLKRAREDILRLVAASPALSGEFGLANFGTPALYDLMDARRMMPTGNFRRTQFEGAAEMNASAYRRIYEPKKTGCRGCPILCKKMGRDGRSIPEFETMSHFSALLENHDIETVLRANEICNETGMDTISAAATLACYSEIEGRVLKPGEIISLLEDIGRGKGEGIELGRGSARYAALRGRKEAAIAVKDQELPAYDPRGAYGMALAYAVSTRGGCHLRAYPISHEILRKPVAVDRLTFSGKARIIKIAEDLNAAVDSLGACKFVFFAATLEEYAKAFTAVTGIEMTAQQLLRAGERINYRERIMNALNGFSQMEDDLPPRFFAEPGSGDRHMDVPPIDREEFLRARQNYYRIRGLDEAGRPLPEKAKELGLEWTGW
jgi:aldehyde:ferredoxin oxidoreductase